MEDIANRNHYMIDLTNVTHDLIFLVSVLDLFICFVRVSLFCSVFFSFFLSFCFFFFLFGKVGWEGGRNRGQPELSLKNYLSVFLSFQSSNSFMFWTDWGLNPKIERATSSGKQRSAIVTTNLYHPNGLDLDKGNQRIFWVDAALDRVESIDYNGGNRKLLFQRSGLHPFGVTLVPPFLFFTDWNTNREVHKLDALTGEVFRSYTINGGKPMGVVVYDGSRQPSGQLSPMHANTKGFVKSIMEFYLELSNQIDFLRSKLLMQHCTKTFHHIINSILIIYSIFLFSLLQLDSFINFYTFDKIMT